MAVAVCCALALCYALTRPVTPQGGRYPGLLAGVVVLLAVDLAFLGFRRALYRRVAAGNLLLAVLGFAAPLLAFEVAANLLNLRGFLYYADTQRYFRWQQWDGTPLAHEHPAQSEITFEWGVVRTNSDGWRSPEISATRPSDTFRVLGLGDSVMFSWGVDEPGTLRVALEQSLAERIDALPGFRGVEMINAGNCSFSTVDELIVLKRQGFRYELSAALVLVVDNDFMDRPAYRDQVEFLAQTKLENPQLIATLAATSAPRDVRADKGASGTAFHAVAYGVKRSFTATTLGYLVRRFRDSHAGVAVHAAPRPATPPAGEALRRRYPFLQEQTEALREIALALRIRDVPLVVSVYGAPNLTSHLRGELSHLAAVYDLRFPEGVNPLLFRNSPTDAHWNRDGNRLFGRLLAEQVLATIAGDGPR